MPDADDAAYYFLYFDYFSLMLLYYADGYHA